MGDQMTGSVIKEERLGLRIHLTVYLCVTALLMLINLAVSPEFLWFLFPFTGMGAGVLLHYILSTRERA